MFKTTVALLIAGTMIAAPAPATAQKKPTVVLVHGAWADASSWDGVIRALQRSGYAVSAPANPLRGLATDAAYLADHLKTVKGPIILAGHSYGGAVISNAATGNPSVRALVYVNAFIPDAGESVLDLAGAVPGSSLGGDPATVFDFGHDPALPAESPDLYVKRTLFGGAFAADLPKATTAALAARQRPIALGALAEKSAAPAWKTIKAWALLGTADKIIPLAGQRLMAKRAHAKTTEIKASHLSPVSEPGAVTKVIVRAANG